MGSTSRRRRQASQGRDARERSKGAGVLPALTINVTMERRAAEALALELRLLAASHGLSVKDLDIAVERRSRPSGRRADRADHRKLGSD